MLDSSAPTVTDTVATVRALLGTDVTATTTGGGCTAIIAGPLDDGSQVWITDVTGCHATPDPSAHPDRDAWMVGLYANEEAALYGEGTVVESEHGRTGPGALLDTIRRALSRPAV